MKNIPQPAIIEICLEALEKSKLEAEFRLSGINSSIAVLSRLLEEWIDRKGE